MTVNATWASDVTWLPKQANVIWTSVNRRRVAGTRKVIVPEYTLQWSHHTWRMVFPPGRCILRVTWKSWSMPKLGNRMMNGLETNILWGTVGGTEVVYPGNWKAWGCGITIFKYSQGYQIEELDFSLESQQTQLKPVGVHYKVADLVPIKGIIF